MKILKNQIDKVKSGVKKCGEKIFKRISQKIYTYTIDFKCDKDIIKIDVKCENIFQAIERFTELTEKFNCKEIKMVKIEKCND